MAKPYDGNTDLTDWHLAHHDKPKAQKQGHHGHNSHLYFYCHALALDKFFKVIFIQLC